MLIAGGILFLVAVGAFFWARSQRKRVAMLASTETLPCDRLEVDQPCEVVGQAQPGPGGTLEAPASKKECVWWRRQITEHWEEWERDDDGDQRRVNRSNVVSDETSGQPFALRDQTGQALVSPDGADVDHPPKSHDVRMDKGSQSLGSELLEGLFSGARHDREIEIEEWILPVGQQLYVRGQPTDAELGMMMIDPGSDFLISTRSEEELASSAKLWLAVATWTAAVAAIVGAGLVAAGIATA